MRIAFISTNRADIGLLTPIFAEAIHRGHSAVVRESADLLNSPREYDWVVCAFDRREMVLEAHKVFYGGGRIVQLAAGDIRIGGGDERNRWAISSYASLLIPWTLAASERCLGFVRLTGLPVDVWPSWPTSWDYVTPVIPERRDFDLVLLNPPYTAEDIARVRAMTWPETSIWLTPNDSCPDQQNNVTMTHEEFLGALTVARRFITNSSSSWYTAPRVLRPDQIVRVGERNQVGDPVMFVEPNQASVSVMNALEFIYVPLHP